MTEHIKFYSRFITEKGGELLVPAPHRQFSNFWHAPIYLNKKWWNSVEHYYQAHKSLDPEDQERIRNLQWASEAKKAGRHVKLREDWEEVKEDIMLKALRDKFSRYKRLKESLLATGDAILHEDSPTDMYWGIKGKDRLGALLMQVRDELREKGE